MILKALDAAICLDVQSHSGEDNAKGKKRFLLGENQAG